MLAKTTKTKSKNSFFSEKLGKLKNSFKRKILRFTELCPNSGGVASNFNVLRFPYHIRDYGWQKISLIFEKLIYLFAGIGIAGFILTSCAPIKRHQRLVEKYPFVHSQDSVILIDTFRVEIPKVEVDTIIKIENLTDTITLEKERLKIKIWKVRDSIFINGKCDTVYIEKEIIRKVPIRYYVEKKKHDWLKWAIAWAIVLFTIYAIIRKKSNE
jgi:hypothetical protein